MYISDCTVLFIIFIYSIVNAHLPPPFDIHIDYYKVDTSHDLIINTPRPRFSWKIPLLYEPSHRNVHQTAYQMQPESTKLSQRDRLCQWDSERVISSESIHVSYTGDDELLPSTYYRFRVRIWTTS